MNPYRHTVVCALSAALFFGVPLSFGQSPPQLEEEVLVNATKSPFSIDAKALRRAAAAFDKDRSLAPEAPLRFRAIDSTPKGEALRIWIERDDAVETILAGPDDLLTLPQIAFTDGTRLHANRSKETLTLTPEILSPGTALHTRRIGDLRLQCRVDLALHIYEEPLYVRALMPPVSMVCNSKNFGYYAYAGFQVASAKIRSTDAVKSVKGDETTDSRDYAAPPLGYVAPLGDRSISDDAVIELK